VTLKILLCKAKIEINIKAKNAHSYQLDNFNDKVISVKTTVIIKYNNDNKKHIFLLIEKFNICFFIGILFSSKVKIIGFIKRFDLDIIEKGMPLIKKLFVEFKL